MGEEMRGRGMMKPLRRGGGDEEWKFRWRSWEAVEVGVEVGMRVDGCGVR